MQRESHPARWAATGGEADHYFASLPWRLAHTFDTPNGRWVRLIPRGGTGTADDTLPPEIVNARATGCGRTSHPHLCRKNMLTERGVPEKTWHISSSVPGKTGRSCRLWIWLPLPSAE